jgi:acetolactate synthase-1/2/3 large subunit
MTREKTEGSMNGAQVIIRSLEDLGVSYVFGYTGGSILPVFDALSKSAITTVINANEQCSGHAAAGFARSTGKPGVAIVTSGPAITNALTAVADAYSDSIPIIVIAGQVPEHKIGTDAFQHIDVARLFKGITKKAVCVKKGDAIEETIKDAYFLARSGKPGPVVIDVPKDCQLAPARYDSLPATVFEEMYAITATLSDEDCARFFALLTQAKRPLLYVGGGAVDASPALRHFNERFRLPSVNTLMGKGVIDERDPVCMGMLGMFGAPAANTLIQKNDFFFALGVRWDDRVAEKVGEFAIQAKIAYIDINPLKVHEIIKERQPSFTFVGDAKAALERLTIYAQHHDITIDIEDWRKEAWAIKESFIIGHAMDRPAIQEAQALEALSERLTGEEIITTGVGNHQMFAAQRIPMREPRRFLSSGSFGTMGFGVPCALGAAMAHPERDVIAIDGDGSLLMNLGELATVASACKNLRVLVLNNHGDGMVRNLQDALGQDRFGTTHKERVGFAAAAKACGFACVNTIRKREGLDEAIRLFLGCAGSSFLEVVCDPEETLYPRIPAGRPYSGMELGPHIRRK